MPELEREDRAVVAALEAIAYGIPRRIKTVRSILARHANACMDANVSRGYASLRGYHVGGAMGLSCARFARSYLKFHWDMPLRLDRA